MSPMPPPTRLRVRACFLSDIHLGFRGCRAEYLLDSLDSVECDTLYLVGDIVDLWSLKRSVYWPKAHHEVLRALLERARGGTRVVYVPGHHDRPFREFHGWVLGQVANPDGGGARDRRWPALPDSPRRRVRQRDPREPTAGVAGKSRLCARASAQPLRQRRAPPAGLSLLVGGRVFDGRFALLRWTEESRLIGASVQDGPTRQRLQDALAA